MGCVFYRALAGVAVLTLTSATAQPLKGQEPQIQRDFGEWGVDLNTGDPATNPGDSLFDHVNGAWYKTNVIPSDQTSSGISADTANLTAAQLRAIVEESRTRTDDSPAGKIGKLFSSFMDEATLERLDDKPIQADLARLRAVTDKTGMAAFMGTTQGAFGASLYAVGVVPDLKGAKVYTAAMGTSGRGLPDRDFYLADQFKGVRDAYLQYLERTLELIGWPDPKGAAVQVMAFERATAEASWSRTEKRDPNKVYHPMTIGELVAYAPDFAWREWLQAAGMPAGLDRIIVSEDTAVPKIARIYAATPMDVLKSWQAFHLADQASPFLSRRFVDNQFAFQRLISGQQQLRPRWRRGVTVTDNALGEALGQLYVQRHFPASSKQQMEALVANLQRAMRSRIEQAAWMSAATRKEALLKLDRQRVKVGYPDKWRDYSSLRIDARDLYGNMKRAGLFAHRYQIDRLGQPQDLEEWAMTPQTVNAYFNPLANEIVFPAAMLQPPMFSVGADAAVNYGAIGSVIGHEITHSFDDTGRQFDHAGELRDWWAPEDAARFQREAARLAAQYDRYEAVPGAKVNGKLTVGENIGDQGGVTIAYDAYKASLYGKPAPRLNGLTGDQRFFMAWAQAWRKKVTDDTAKLLVVSDVHSPARWRVDGTVRNIDAWYAAFDVKPGHQLYLSPEARVRIW